MNKYIDILIEEFNSQSCNLSQEEKDGIIKYLDELEGNSLWLRCLEEAGVDNWEGCEYAAELLEQQ